MAVNKQKDLGFLGLNFQYRLVSAFFQDTKFYRDFSPIIDHNMFTDPHLRRIVGILNDFFTKYDYVPNKDVFETELRSKTNNEQEVEFLIETFEKILNTSTEGIDSTKEHAEKFFKQQNLVKAINQIKKIVEMGDLNRYPECEDIIRNVLVTGNREELGERIFDDLGEVLSEDYRNPIPTGIDALDKLLEGGIGEGELGLIIAAMGVGKTTITTAIANAAATTLNDKNNYKGYKVLQIFFEDKYRQIKRKHIGKLTDIEAKDLSKPSMINTVKDIIDTSSERDLLNNNIVLKRFYTGSVTVTDIRNHVKKLINVGFKPDLITIDYFECIIPAIRTKDVYQSEGPTMRALETMASELNVGIWVTTQGTKDSINCDILTTDKASGSADKTRVAHIILSIAKQMEDMNNNTATIALLKNRAGLAGSVLQNITFNNGTCKIDTSNIVEYDSMANYEEHREAQTQNVISELVKKATIERINKKENEDKIF